jgi:hypothetical protein
LRVAFPDVVFDVELIPALVGTLSKLLHPRDNQLLPSAIVACTERNQETLNRFLYELGNVLGIPFHFDSSLVTISISFLIFFSLFSSAKSHVWALGARSVDFRLRTELSS